MKDKDLKCVVGKVEADKPAIIRFYGSVDSDSTYRFNDEFLWLQNYIKPSKIIVLINSEGGSVIYGMSTFSIIQSCPIPVDCVIEGIAASMGSVIWAAGQALYMHDYSILMIHNPFASNKCDNEDTKAMVNAFRDQIATIYQRRFGLSKEAVEKIMDGDDNVDGTYFNAKEACEAGILPTGNIIKTSQTIRNKVKDETNGLVDAVMLRNAMSSIIGGMDEKKLLEGIDAIREKGKEQIQAKVQMETKNEVNFGTVAAQLGYNVDVQASIVSARITELLKAEASLKDVNAKYEQLDIQFKGKEQEAKNFKDELEKAQASLKVYQDKEKAALEAAIEAMVQSAIDAGKIDANSKQSWVEAAHTNFGMAQKTLDSIQGRQVISSEIAGDKVNQAAAQAAAKTEEQKLNEKIAAKVNAVCGENFEFKTFNA